MQYCDLENVRLAYHMHGSSSPSRTGGPRQTNSPILLVHGYPFNSQIWSRTSDLLVSEDCCVITPDLRGFRQSPPPDPCPVTTMECLADDLFLLLEKIGMTEKIVLVGLSMGGYVAMQFARKYADRLSKIVLCGTKTIADPPQIADNRRKQAAALLDGSLSLADVADAMIPKLFSPVTKERNPELMTELRNIIIESRHVQGVAAATLGMAERTDTTEVLRQLYIPVLAVCGTDDQFSPPSEMRGLAETARQGTFMEIPESGHLPPMEQPERFVSAIFPSSGANRT